MQCIYNSCKKFFLILLNLIFTYRCCSCGIYLPYYAFEGICDDCFNKQFKPNCICLHCNNVIDDRISHVVCHSYNKPYAAEKIICASFYNGSIKRIVRDLKYHNKEQLSHVLAYFILNTLIFYEEILKKIDVIIPVPIYIGKKIENHSFFIANSLKNMINDIDQLNVNLSTDLVKIRNNVSQTQLSRSLRKENVKDAFDLKTNINIKDKSILLIDDVLTTGATTSECAIILKKKGRAKSVFISTVTHQPYL